MERRSRRPTAEVLAAVRAAASRQFTELGYDATTMRSVAAEADVALSVVQRHFATKEDLFSRTVLTDLMGDFASLWQRQAETGEPEDPDRLLHALVEELFERIRRHRVGAAHIVRRRVEDADKVGTAAARDALAGLISDLQRIGEVEASRRGWFRPEEAERSSLLMIAMILGTVLMQPFLPEDHWAADDSPQTDVIDAITRMGLYGLALRPRGAP